MTAPYVQVCETRLGQIGSVVMDQEDFDLLIDEMEEKNQAQCCNGGLQKCREAKHIPLIGIGPETAWVFERFGLETKLMAVVVRGFAKRILGGQLES